MSQFPRLYGHPEPAPPANIDGSRELDDVGVQKGASGPRETILPDRVGTKRQRRPPWDVHPTSSGRGSPGRQYHEDSYRRLSAHLIDEDHASNRANRPSRVLGLTPHDDRMYMPSTSALYPKTFTTHAAEGSDDMESIRDDDRAAHRVSSSQWDHWMDPELGSIYPGSAEPRAHAATSTGDDTRDYPYPQQLSELLYHSSTTTIARNKIEGTPEHDKGPAAPPKLGIDHRVSHDDQSDGASSSGTIVHDRPVVDELDKGTTGLGTSSSEVLDQDHAELCDDGNGLNAACAVAGSPCVAETADCTSSRMSTPSGNSALVNHEQTVFDEQSTTSDLFAEAEAYLERLERGILALEEASDSASDVDDSDSDATVHDALRVQISNTPRERSDATDDDHKDSGGDSSDGTDSRTGTLPPQETEASGSPQRHKRQKRKQPTGSDDGHARTRVASAEQDSELTRKRFICCFHNGPGRKCSGTDKNVSEILKELRDQHDTHICGRCWVLKVKDQTSGTFEHPQRAETCHDYCLSPKCHGKPHGIAHRHEFDTNICGTLTSRPRKNDGEAIFRFIFSLVHPELEAPESVLTDEHKLHGDALPRQGHRKPNTEELRVIAADLRKKLEELGEQHHAQNKQTKRLKKKLAKADKKAKKERKRITNLEARTRRIVGMLEDALRTGIFLDQAGHASLLARVEDDVPSALSSRTQDFLTPSTSDESQRSSTTTDMAEAPDMAAQSQMPEANASQGFAHGSSLPPSCDGVLAPDLDLDGQEIDFSWLEPFDESGDKSILPGV